MFSRRHPFLFSILVFTGIVAATLVILGLTVTLGFRHLTGFDDLGISGKGNVGVVELSGVIVDPHETIAHLKRFRDDEAIKAIVIRIDSPGGGVGPAQEIYREIIKTRKKKKLVASMGSLAASGGYYVAAGADKIMANPGTITGSIGVIMGYTNFEKLFEKIGLVPVVVKSGPYKDIGSPARPMSAQEKQLLQQVIDGIHRRFVEDIAEGRGLPVEKVEQVADGRIFTGEAALEMGLVDRLGNVEDAVQWAGELAGLEGAVEAVYAREREFSWLEYLFESVSKVLLEKGWHDQLFAGYLYLPGK